MDFPGRDFSKIMPTTLELSVGGVTRIRCRHFPATWIFKNHATHRGDDVGGVRLRVAPTVWVLVRFAFSVPPT